MCLSSNTLPMKMFWNHTEHLGAVFCSALMLIIALDFTDRENWLRPRLLIPLLAIPIGTIIINWTNSWHHLYYIKVWCEPHRDYAILFRQHGLFYVLFFTYVYVVVTATLIIILCTLRSPPAHTTQLQLVLLLAAMVIPLLFNISYVFRLIPNCQINFTQLGFFCSSLLLSVAMFRYQLLTDMQQRQKLLQEAKEELELRNEHLLQQAHSTNEKLVQMINGREEELRIAISEALTAAETEERRIGQEIHDSLCQDIVGFVRLLEKVERDTDQHSNVTTTIRQLRELATRLAAQARAISHELTLHEMDVLTLQEALETMASQFETYFHSNIEINMVADTECLSHQQSVHLYRIIREAVYNAIKHAQSDNIWVDIITEKKTAIVSISNDGKTLPDEIKRIEGLGIKQMRMRTRLLQGSFTMQRNSQNITVVQITIPLPHEEKV